MALVFALGARGVAAEELAPGPAASAMGALELGKPVERRIGGGETHRFTVRLAAGQFLWAVVEQKGVDVAVALVGRDGAPIVAVDSPNGVRGRETIRIIAEARGEVHLDVQVPDTASRGGLYEARIEELHAATARDRQLVEATQRTGQSVLLGYGEGNSLEALPLGERAAELFEQALGPEHPDLAASLEILAYLYRETGAYRQSEAALSRSLQIREAAFGPQHPDVGLSLHYLALLFYIEGQYARSEPLYLRAVAIQEAALGSASPDLAETLNDLGLLYQDEGQFAKAEPLYARALKVFKQALGPDHLLLGTSINNLASLYEVQGRYAQAEPLFARALAIFEQSLGADHPEVATPLNNLAFVYQEQGQYAKAEPLYLRALANREGALGPEHYYVALSLNNLASLYRDQGHYAQAEPLIVRALAIWEKAFGPEHPDVATPLINLALLRSYQEQYAQAEPLYARALAIREKALGPDHPDVAYSLNLLAALYRARLDYARAEPLFMRALAIREQALGPDHPDVAIALNNLAGLYEATARAVQAVDLRRRGSDAREGDLQHNLLSGSERAKLVYLALTADEADACVSLQTRLPSNPAALALALESILRRKGRALDAMARQVEALRDRAAPADRELLDSLFTARGELARVTLAGPGEDPIDVHRARLAELDARVEDLERDVSARSQEFAVANRPVTLDAVRARIPPDARLVEFFAYRPYDAATNRYGERRYAVYVAGPPGEGGKGGDRGASGIGRGIGFAELGAASAIDAAVERLRAALRDPRSREVKKLARALDAHVFEPVRRLAGPVRHLLVAPDGALNLVPLGALVDRRGRYLVETHEITYLTSGRDLLRLAGRDAGKQPAQGTEITRTAQAADPPEPALIVADPAYGDEALAASAQTREIVQKQAESGQAATDFGDVYFPPLAYTALEAATLTGLLDGATVLTGAQATEAALKAAHAPRVLHVATHGFFLQDLGIRAADARAVDFGDAELLTAGVRIENPLLRSGLALAGANARKSGADDGVLTALEVAGLDLWGTRLVVLSACNTGVGEVKTGDGVYGLRRALVLAGSESQVMSLWSVPDQATRDLMVAYYRSLLRGEGRTAALRQVQLQMLRAPGTSHPYYWAAFIQSGEWANLEGVRTAEGE